MSVAPLLPAKHRLPSSLPWMFLLLGLLSLGGCQRAEPLYQQQFYVFGTLVNITVWGAKPEQAASAVNSVAQDLQRMHHAWHAWHPGPLAELNQALAAGQAFRADPSLLPLIAHSQTLYRQSEGLFNPAIGGLMALWGFHNDELPVGPPPAPEAIAAWVARHPGMDDVEIEGDRVRSRNPAVQLDFGAIAKGYAVDLAARRLREMGMENAIVNAGGNLRAYGRRGERPWRIGIRHPSGEGILASLEIRGDEGVFTSGDYERFHEYQGKRYSHIIDPRSGWPVQGAASVTVIHPDGSVADAASTALSVAGLKDWWRIAKQMGIVYAMLVDADGKVYISPEMAERIRFEIAPPPKVELSAPLSGQ